MTSIFIKSWPLRQSGSDQPDYPRDSVLYLWVGKATAAPTATEQEIDAVKEEQQGLRFLISAARLIFLSRFLFAAAMVTLLTNWVNTNGEILVTIQVHLTESALTSPPM